MKVPNLIFLCVLLVAEKWFVSANNAPTRTQSSVIQTSDAAPDANKNRDVSASSVLGSMYRKSRQSRCVRCYEDRYGYDDRYRGGYSSRTSEDRNWYYPSYDTDRDRSYYSNYRDRDDRYSSRTYDRYEPRGYADRYGGDRYSADRYGADRYGADRYGDRYDDRRTDYYRSDRYGDSYKDRYYDRSRAGDRDYYDRSSNPRYDYRNYRPYDETYRGQSGFDNSGRGYYFAGDDNRDTNSRRYLPETTGRKCGILVTNCPYDRDDGGQRVSSRPIESDNRNVGISSPNSYNYNNNNNNSSRNSGWNYLNEQNSQSQHSGGGGGGGVGGDGNSGSDRNRENDRDRNRDQSQDRDRNQQSSSYAGRPPRPLGGSYLFDRDSNEVKADGQNNAKGMMTEANNGGGGMNQSQSSRDGSSSAGAGAGPGGSSASNRMMMMNANEVKNKK